MFKRRTKQSKKGENQQNTSTNENKDFDDHTDFPAGPTPNHDDLILKSFFDQIDTINTFIKEEIPHASKRIREIDEEIKFAIGETETILSQNVQTIIQNINEKAKATHKVFELLRSENEQYESEKTMRESDLRIRKNVVNTYSRKFINEMREFQIAQRAYKVNILKKATQQVHLIKEDATPEEVDEIMKSEGGIEQFFQQSILGGSINQSITQTYTKITDKYHVILALEQSLTELNQMSVDFALLVEQQSPLLDEIEFNVKSAVENVDKGNKHVYDALELQKKRRFRLF